ncbi:hypothetical protein IQ255_22625 [Pleurocapsales cyanobacterium LEGE 10410]|nr:hypothetical protein [Pleurocapsales cyanobacterium LEGE 10410]
MKVEDRIQVYCHKKLNSVFQKQRTFKNCLLDMIGNNHYHPVEKYLEGLQQNCTNPANIDNLAERYLGNKNELSNLLVKKTLIAAVARIFKPGCEVHSVLILCSPKQGIGKSSFLKTLAVNPLWFNDTVPKISVNRDFYSKLHRHWITEVGEIDTKFNKNQEEKIKDFITSTKDSFRPAYTAQFLNCRRRFILTGTTNNGNFLKDQTGSRRYWIVRVNGKIDIPALKKEVDAIWAAAVQAFFSGEQWWLTDEEAELVEESNASYCYEHSWYQPIKSYLDEHKDDKYILPKNIAAISSLEIPRKEINKPSSKAIKEIRTLLQQKFEYAPKKISNQQRQKLFDELTNDSSLRPQVSSIKDIPYSIWVKFDELFEKDSV